MIATRPTRRKAESFLAWMLSRFLESEGDYWKCPQCDRGNPSIMLNTGGKVEKFRCANCRWFGDEHDILKFYNPASNYGDRKAVIADLKSQYENGPSGATSHRGGKYGPGIGSGIATDSAAVNATDHSDAGTGGGASAGVRPGFPPMGVPTDYWAELNDDFIKQINRRKNKGKLAELLGLPLGPIHTRFRQSIGWDGDKQRWTFSERDGHGNIIGIAHRSATDSGKLTPVQSFKGAKRGLFLPDDWESVPGSIFVTEGISDTLAGAGAGLSVVGRPSAKVGAAHLTELLCAVSPTRKVVVVGDDDPAGIEGVRVIADYLRTELSRPVGWYVPPRPHGDLREWLTSLSGPWCERGELLKQRFDERNRP